MTPEVREKLDRLDDLFPPERLSRSKERWTRLWHGDPPLDRRPFVYAPYKLNYYDAGFSAEERLHANLDEFLARGIAQDDFIPAFFPGCHQGTMPNLFGAVPVQVDADFTCARLIETPDDIDRLPPPSFSPGTVAHEWLTMQRYALEETEGRLPIHVMDMQGPADVCGQLWGYENLLAAAYTDPVAYHVLLQKVTEAFIGFWDAQRTLAGELFVGTHLFGWDWVPADAGASISADSLVMVSAPFYQEFYQPYLQQIGEHFGGMAVHSCGNFSATAPALCATPSLKAVNAGQMSVAELVAAGVDGRTIIIAWSDVSVIGESFSHAAAHGLRLDLTVSGLWPCDEHGVKPRQDWTREDVAHVQRTDATVQDAAATCSR